MDNQIQKTLIPAHIIFQERHTIYTERRRQACWAFNLFCGLTGFRGRQAPQKADAKRVLRLCRRAKYRA